MTTTRKAIISISLSLWAVLLTAITGVFGGAPLRAQRFLLGSVGYWLSLTILVAAVWLSGWELLGAGVLGLGLVVGVYSDFEEHGLKLVPGAFGSLAIAYLFLAGGVGFWMAHHGAGWKEIALNGIQTTMGAVPNWEERLGVQAKDLMLQIPSVVAIILILGLYFALLFQKRFESLIRRSLHEPPRLTDFSVPDSFIWFFMLGLGAAFWKSEITWLAPVGLNLLNVSVVIFFLQGLAVVVRAFDIFKVGPFWQALMLIVLVSQLFLLLSVVGLADYWLNFRERMKSRNEQMDREIFKK